MKTNQLYIRIIFAVLFAFALPDFAWAYGPALQPGTVFDGITSTFKKSSAGWMSSAQGYAHNLFLSLAAIEFSWAAIQLTMKKGELQDMIASTMMKVVGIGFFYSLLMMAPTWIPAIMDSFGMAGAAVGANGGSAAMLSPSGIFDQGISVAGTMVSAMNSSNSGNLSASSVVSSGGASIGSFLFGAIVTGLSGLLTILAFTLVAVQLMVTLIESYIVIGGGVLMMGFLGSRWTLPFGEKYFGYAVSTGIKLFTLYLIVGQGQNVANQIIHALTANGAAPGPVDFMGAGASSLAYGAMGYMVPALAGSMMNGSPSLSMGNMAAAGGGIAGSIVGAAAMAGATALSGLSAATGMFNKTSKAAGNIGGDALGAGGSIGGSMPGSTDTTMAGGNSAGFGAGSSSQVAAPPGMDAGAGSSTSGVTAQPTPAPAAMADINAMPATSAGKSSSVASSAAPAEAPSASATPAMSMVNPAESGAATTTAQSEVSSQEAGKAKTGAAAKPETNGNAGSSSTQSANVTPTVNASAKGRTDAAVDPKKKGFDLDKKAESLNDMARRMDKLPVNDGHAGGISIKLNHIE